jgi:hypothetical protein
MHATSLFLSVFFSGVFVLGCCVYSLLDHWKKGCLVSKRRGPAARIAQPVIHSCPWRR